MAQVGRLPLVESSWALRREAVQLASWGGYAMTTLWGCPTRKYHSWLSLWKGFERYELLPQMQEEVLVKAGHFLLTTQFFYGRLSWEGYRHLQGFSAGKGWTWYYQIGDLRIEKQVYLGQELPLWVLRYSFSGEVLFRWIPLWAVRPWHTLRVEPPQLERHGDRLHLGESLTLTFQVFPTPRFIPWAYAYEGVYYPEEAARGYPAQENLWSLECWEWRLHGPGEIYIAFSPAARPPLVPMRTVSKPPRSFQEVLWESAEHFFLRTDRGEYIVAGHPWFGVWGRDTFISLPGLTLAREEVQRFHRVMEAALHHRSEEGQFPNTFPNTYTAEDTGLWWVWALIQAHRMGMSAGEIWRYYGEPLQAVLVYYLQRWAGEDGLLRFRAVPPASWMDAQAEGQPIVWREGALVELNALWYAALRFVATIAPQEGVRWRWDLLARRVLAAFKPTFWQKARGYLADWCSSTAASWQIRPNQLLAVALPYRPISDKVAELVLDTVERHLLTPRGLRTLSPADPLYHGRYEGPPALRDRAYHNGTVWPWLLGIYADAKLALLGEAAKPALRKLWQGFEEAAYAYGWGTIAEIYDGDAPHLPRGAPAQAWSVGELLRLSFFLERP
ncbi:MAG: amylo-alpha-1,6-glucosidase [Bacteroidia bacterium]|nr:amylo-alpha-1,6-glucosidase [Bacteroidia bacterium]MDW8088292.1 amylo-alpha-1,6-glucosidase [Bacteroidia bacterium]